MGMIIDNRVLSYPTDLQTGILLIASTGIKFAIQKGSFDEFLTVMSTYRVDLYFKRLFPFDTNRTFTLVLWLTVNNNFIQQCFNDGK